MNIILKFFKNIDIITERVLAQAAKVLSQKYANSQTTFTDPDYPAVQQKSSRMWRDETNQIVADFQQVKDDAVTQINNLSSNAQQAINTGIQDINDARTNALQLISAAQTSAINAINQVQTDNIAALNLIVSNFEAYIQTQTGIIDGKVTLATQEADRSSNHADDSESFSEKSNIWADGDDAVVEQKFGVGKKSSRRWSEISEGHADESRIWNEGEPAEVIALGGEKSSKDWNADIQATKDKLDKIDFDGAVENDLFRFNSSGVAVPVKKQNIGKDKTLYRLAPVNSFFSPKDIVFFDNASKDVANGTVLTELDSGQSWQSFITANTVAYSTVAGGGLVGSGASAGDGYSAVIPWGLGSIGIEWSARRVTQGIPNGVIIAAKDTSNFIIFERQMESAFTGGLSTSTNYRLVAVIGGVGTVLGSIDTSSIYEGGNVDGFNQTTQTFIIKYGWMGRNNGSRIVVISKENSSVRLSVDVISLNTTFATSADLAFTGICGSGQSNTSIKRIIGARLW